jgi:hypothetical protein
VKSTAGRPTKIELCSLFLPAPFSVMKLDGIPPRKLFAELGQEALYRRVFPPKTDPRKVAPPRLIADMVAWIQSIAAPVAIKGVLVRAFNGDPEALAQLDAMGDWKMMRLGMKSDIAPKDMDWCHVVFEHGVEVEIASRDVDHLARTHTFDGIPALVERSHILAPYLSSTAKACLGKARSAEEAGWPQFAGACEFLLSQVARVDAHPSEQFGARARDRFIAMTQGDHNESCTPGRGLVQWMMQRYGARSVADLLKLAPADVNGCQPLAYNALQGWHTGSTLPTRSIAIKLVEAIVRHQGLQGDDLHRELKLFDLQLWAACRIEATLRLVRYVAACKPVAGSASALDLLESTSPDEWCRRRYDFWLAHWEKGQATAQTVT